MKNPLTNIPNCCMFLSQAYTNMNPIALLFIKYVATVHYKLFVSSQQTHQALGSTISMGPRSNIISTIILLYKCTVHCTVYTYMCISENIRW